MTSKSVVVVSGRGVFIRSKTMSRGATAQVSDYEVGRTRLHTRGNANGRSPDDDE
jgi:hypothetical protein